MAALAADADRQSQGAGRERTYGMAIGSSTTNTIYKGGFVSLNSGGYAVSGSDTASEKCVGVCIAQAVNTGANGAVDVRVFTAGDFLFTHAGGDLAITNVGNAMFMENDNEIEDTDGQTNDIACGIICEYVSATQGWLRIDNYAPAAV